MLEAKPLPSATDTGLHFIEHQQPALRVANLAQLLHIIGPEHIHAGLRAALSGLPGVVDIRGEGLMIGIELDRPCAELVAIAREQGVLINVTADNVIRLVPPLIFGQTEADALIAEVASYVTLFLTQAA